MDQNRGLYDSPPTYRPTSLDRPTLLVTYWCSLFAFVIILARIIGRFVRTLKVFPDDMWMASSIVPLFIRLGLVHLVLIWGTNNMDLSGLGMVDEGSHISNIPGPRFDGEIIGLSGGGWEREVRRRTLGSKIVLGARIAYVAFIWSQKFCITEFYRKMTLGFYSECYEMRLKIIRYCLLGTFVAITITTLAECNSFHKYWQVYPDPGPQCRQGLAPLLATTICSVITDLLLVFFPMPAIIRSKIPFKRKSFLVISLSLPLILVFMSIYKVPFLLSYKSAQPQRSLWSSLECLASCAVANAIVLNSFVRDKGPKRNKYRGPGGPDMLYSPANVRVRGANSGDALDKITVRRGTKLWGSDEDLIRDSGVGMDEELRRLSDRAANTANSQLKGQSCPSDYKTPAMPKPPYMAPFKQSVAARHTTTPGNTWSGLERWRFHQDHQASRLRGGHSPSIPEHSPCDTPPNASQEQVSFSDVGGLLKGESIEDQNGPDHSVYGNSIDLEAQRSQLCGLRPSPSGQNIGSSAASSTSWVPREDNRRDTAGRVSLTTSTSTLSPINNYYSTNSLQLFDIGGLLSLSTATPPASLTVNPDSSNVPNTTIGLATTCDERIDFIRRLHASPMDLSIHMNPEEQMDLQLHDVGGLLRRNTNTNEHEMP